MGGWVPPSLRARFIAIFRTQSLLETFLSPFYYSLLLPCCEFLLLGAKKRTRAEAAFSSCLADADRFCFRHRSPVPGVQGWVCSAAALRGEGVFRTVCEGTHNCPTLWLHSALGFWKRALQPIAFTLKAVYSSLFVSLLPQHINPTCSATVETPIGIAL